ncbi:hypothetical protein FRC08_017046 [Ceratobasidium sp. 394]|nr:hypothetical protein FRC08_017046 [Ceratobasidium sp. 394]
MEVHTRPTCRDDSRVCRCLLFPGIRLFCGATPESLFAGSYPSLFEQRAAISCQDETRLLAARAKVNVLRNRSTSLLQTPVFLGPLATTAVSASSSPVIFQQVAPSFALGTARLPSFWMGA